MGDVISLGLRSSRPSRRYAGLVPLGEIPSPRHITRCEIFGPASSIAASQTKAWAGCSNPVVERFPDNWGEGEI